MNDGLKNAYATFGPVKYGKPTGKVVKPAISDRAPDRITEENWFFMTGTLYRAKFIHNERCGGRCKCDEERKCANRENIR